MIDQATIARYQKDGDLYAKVASQYGSNAADQLAQAARTGDRSVLTETIAAIRSGPARTGTSTLGNFVQQITTDPLAAPLDAANKQFGNIILGLFRNPWVLLVLIVVALSYSGGWESLDRIIKGKR